MQIKPDYSVPELAKATGRSRRAMDRLLKKNGVRFLWVGSDRRVTLTEIRRALSDWWDSVILARQLRDEL